MVLALVENGEFDIETTTELAIGVSALCCLATAAFAGGPDIPRINMNGINLSLGFWYKTYSYDQRAVVVDSSYKANTFLHPYSLSKNQFGPVGEIGYTWTGY